MGTAQVCAYCGTHPRDYQQNCVNCGAPVQRRVVIEPYLALIRQPSSLMREIVDVLAERRKAGRRSSRLKLNPHAVTELPLPAFPGDLLFGLAVEYGSPAMEKPFEVL